MQICKICVAEKTRQKYGEYTIEGIKSVSDALNSEREITALYVSDSFFENEKFKYPKDISLYKVQDDVFMKMCDTKAPQGHTCGCENRR